VIIIDCLTLLVSNMLLLSAESKELASVEDRVNEELASPLDVCRDTASTVIIVSGEVGMGIVPDNLLGRRFRDLLGRANQQLAAQASSVYLMCAGMAIDVRAVATSVDQAVDHLTS